MLAAISQSTGCDSGEPGPSKSVGAPCRAAENRADLIRPRRQLGIKCREPTSGTHCTVAFHRPPHASEPWSR